MASPFAFIPRKVAIAKARTSSRYVSSPSVHGDTKSLSDAQAPLKNHLPPSDVKGKWKGKAKATGAHPKPSADIDCAVSICLSLSDYALWLDSDLRRTIEQSDERFIPLSYLLRHSPILALAGLQAEETLIVRCLKAHVSETLEIRMIISEPSHGRNWQGKYNPGLYEIRRKDWKNMLEHPSRLYSREQWDNRTIYLENIPPQNRSVAGIALLTLSLLQPETQVPLFHRVQSIILPSHQQDGPNDVPQCKGFGLVILSDSDDVDKLLRTWPWNSQFNTIPSDSQTIREAAKFGLRTLPKGRWEELKEEYLGYQRRNLDELVAFNDGTANVPSTEDFSRPKSVPEPIQIDVFDPSPGTPAPTTLDSPYPLSCLVFVRNIHPETNKTTLRKLFSAAFDESSANSLDYVDYVKGADTCYLRLASARHARLLVSHFVSHLTKQNRGLDDTGTVGISGSGITMEIVQGKKEEVYWEKVPEKVRWKAVEMTVSAQYIPQETSMEWVPEDGGTKGPTVAKRRKRKRDN